MSVYFRFVDLDEIKDLQIKIADPRLRDTSFGAPFGSLVPQTYTDGNLNGIASFLWDYHMDWKRRQQYAEKKEYTIYATIEKLPNNTYDIDGTVFGYDPGDGFNDPAHPTWLDQSATFTMDGLEQIHATIQYFDTVALTNGTRTWVSAPTGIITAFDAFQAGLEVPSSVRERTKAKMLYAVVLNFRSFMESDLLSEKDNDPAVVLSGAGPPAASLGKNGDYYQDTTSTTTYGPKTSGSWGSPQPFFIPDDPLLKKYKHREGQVRSGIAYTTKFTPVVLYFFEDDDVKTAYFPRHQTPNLATDPVTTFPIPRPGDYRPYVDLIGANDNTGTINSTPTSGIAVYIPGLAIGLSNPMINPFGGQTSHPISNPQSDVTQNHAWTDGDGRSQTAVFRAIRIGHRFRAEIEEVFE